MKAPSASLMRCLPPLVWLAAAAAAVLVVQRNLLWKEILAGWALVLVNAGLAAGIGRWAARGNPEKQPAKALGAQVGRAFALGVIIFLIFRLDFLNSPAFLSASFAGYLAWLAGHVMCLHRNSLRGN